jgi:hypothetical protein
MVLRAREMAPSAAPAAAPPTAPTKCLSELHGRLWHSSHEGTDPDPTASDLSTRRWLGASKHEDRRSNWIFMEKREEKEETSRKGGRRCKQSPASAPPRAAATTCRTLVAAAKGGPGGWAWQRAAESPLPWPGDAEGYLFPKSIPKSTDIHLNLVAF